MSDVNNPDANMEAYLRGDLLVGDDYDETAVRLWYDDEREGYADLGAKHLGAYEYGYHALNRMHAFSKIQPRRNLSVLGFGSAYGDELLPIVDQIGSVTILEPSEALVGDSLAGLPIVYRKPNPLGKVEFDDASFDLITCFGVLHHVPNVSFVVSEMCRVLRPGGFMLVREPVVSMGDWRKPRHGLTRRERGIPEHLMKKAFGAAGLNIISKRNCDFGVVTKASKAVGIRQPFNNATVTVIDWLFSVAFAWNRRYHRTTIFDILAPASVAWVLQKPEH